MPTKIYEALARTRGTEKWNHVTEEGLRFYANYSGIIVRVQQLATFFPQNEYQIREVPNA